MKICLCCSLPKNEEEFRKNKKKEDGLDIYCKECARLKDKQIYNKNIERNREVGWKAKKALRNKNNEFILNYLKDHPCVDCGEVDPVVLEFDHRGDKKGTISHMSQHSSLDKIKLEIEKCDIRCANCHRRKTAKQLNFYRFKIVE